MQYEIERFGAFLATREKGSKVREDLEKAIKRLSPGEVSEVSFKGVQAATISFADELIGRLMSARASQDLPEVAILLTHLNNELLEAIQVCLERRELVAAQAKGRDVSLLGKVDPHLEKTFQVAYELGEFTASDLADHLGITPQNANNRLKKLTDAGIIIRERRDPDGGGKEFIYRSP